MFIEVTYQSESLSLLLQDSNDYSYIFERNQGNLANISRDLKNLCKSYWISTDRHGEYCLTKKDIADINQLMLNDSKIDDESWSGSIETLSNANEKEGEEEKATPDALLKTGYPEINKQILEQNEKFNCFYIINRKIYECSVYFIKNIERNRKDLVKFIEKHSKAHWQFVYLEVLSKISKSYYRIILKESEVRPFHKLYSRWKQSWNGQRLIQKWY